MKRKRKKESKFWLNNPKYTAYIRSIINLDCFANIDFSFSTFLSPFFFKTNVGLRYARCSQSCPMAGTNRLHDAEVVAEVFQMSPIRSIRRAFGS